MSTPTTDDPTPSDPRWHRWALSPRAAVLTGAVVVTVALGVVGLGALGGPSSDEVTVTGAGTALPGAGRGRTAGPSADADGSSGLDGASPSTASPTASPTASSSVAVYVLGAVGHAGVVQVPAGSRVETVLERAGGAAADADLARLNLARLAVDGERLYVPRVGEDVVPEALAPDTGSGGGTAAGAGGTAGGGAAGGGAAGPAGGGVGPGGPAGADPVVDLNAADQAALETLPGIGPSLAARIIAWRTEHGRFSSVDDLLEVSGIGDGRFAELRDRVRV